MPGALSVFAILATCALALHMLQLRVERTKLQKRVVSASAAHSYDAQSAQRALEKQAANYERRLMALRAQLSAARKAARDAQDAARDAQKQKA